MAIDVNDYIINLIRQELIDSNNEVAHAYIKGIELAITYLAKEGQIFAGRDDINEIVDRLWYQRKKILNNIK